MSDNPFMPQQPNHVKAPLLVGTVVSGIAIFLFTYVKWDSFVAALAVSLVSTALLYVVLRSFLLRRSRPRANRQFNPRRRK